MKAVLPFQPLGVFFLTSLLAFLWVGCGEKPLEEKPNQHPLVLVELTASDCPDCARIHQILQTLKPRYRQKIAFVTFDVSSSLYRQNAQETAHSFNSQGFVKRYQDRPGTVAILNAKNGRKLAFLQNETREERYKEAIEASLKSVDETPAP